LGCVIHDFNIIAYYVKSNKLVDAEAYSVNMIYFIMSFVLVIFENVIPDSKLYVMTLGFGKYFNILISAIINEDQLKNCS